MATHGHFPPRIEGRFSTVSACSINAWRGRAGRDKTLRRSVRESVALSEIARSPHSSFTFQERDLRLERHRRVALKERTDEPQGRARMCGTRMPTSHDDDEETGPSPYHLVTHPGTSASWGIRLTQERTGARRGKNDDGTA